MKRFLAVALIALVGLLSAPSASATERASYDWCRIVWHTNPCVSLNPGGAAVGQRVRFSTTVPERHVSQWMGLWAHTDGRLAMWRQVRQPDGSRCVFWVFNEPSHWHYTNHDGPTSVKGWFTVGSTGHCHGAESTPVQPGRYVLSTNCQHCAIGYIHVRPAQLPATGAALPFWAFGFGLTLIVVGALLTVTGRPLRAPQIEVGL